MNKWVENATSPVQFYCTEDKPNIFLIGDSIRQGYCETVKNRLDDVANVFYFKDNCRSTQYVIFSLKKWASMFNDPSLVDIVHFNCGHWDVAHFSGHELSLTTESEYERNLQIVIDLIKKFFPRAKLIFATSSPMNPNKRVDTNPRTTEEIDRYNEVALKVMEKNNISINNVNGFMRSWGSECFADSCHLTKEAFAVLGEYVAEQLKNYI